MVVQDSFLLMTKMLNPRFCSWPCSRFTRTIYRGWKHLFIQEFYNLKELSTQTTYLTDVIGVIQDHDELRLARFNNRLGQPQTHIKFTITDGKTNVNVTLWDQFAEHFDEAIREEDFETPLIIIIGCGRVTKWKEEVDVSNVGATSFYINYNHHCVSLLRTMLSENHIQKFKKSMVKKEPPRQITIQEIKELGYDDIEIDENVFPEGLKTIEGKEYTMKLAKKGNSYVAKDVSHVIDFENFTTENEDAQPRPIQESYEEGSTATYHLESMSENN
ncbi:hypothetical protein POM88_000711 [Heracleum sosnowskyi]|uniref:Uncharacterized protein n=1 Tax=Heracleum sosnowskyi TaxID=360622 RepID=A0AAD8JCC9_9APIA|nr:hypothetical protein POM88_000711 [Heracleum sosnowskyi]